MKRYTQIPTPCGPLLLVIDERGLCQVDFCHSPQPVEIADDWLTDAQALALCRAISRLLCRRAPHL